MNYETWAQTIYLQQHHYYWAADITLLLHISAMVYVLLTYDANMIEYRSEGLVIFFFGVFEICVMKSGIM